MFPTSITKTQNCPPILLENISEESWAKATQIAQRSKAAIVIVHPKCMSNEHSEQIAPLLMQTYAPIIVLSEAHHLIDTKNWLESNQCQHHVLVPTVPGWPYPFLSREEFNKSLSDFDLAIALQKHAYATPKTMGELETSSSYPSPKCADIGHRVLAAKLKEIGIESVFVAGAYFNGTRSGCAGILLADLSSYFGDSCYSTNLLSPRAPNNALTATQVTDSLLERIQKS